MKKRRGNPNWGKSANNEAVLAIVMPTEFETMVKTLKLKPEQWCRSRKLRAWCEENRNRRYIPEDLLKTFGIHVDCSAGLAF